MDSLHTNNNPSVENFDIENTKTLALEPEIIKNNISIIIHQDNNNNNNADLISLLKTAILDEINYRIINNRDKYALELLSEAKTKLKETIEAQKDNIIWTLLAMKGFYLAASIALGHWTPESV